MKAHWRDRSSPSTGLNWNLLKSPLRLSRTVWQQQWRMRIQSQPRRSSRSSRSNRSRGSQRRITEPRSRYGSALQVKNRQCRWRRQRRRQHPRWRRQRRHHHPRHHRNQGVTVTRRPWSGSDRQECSDWWQRQRRHHHPSHHRNGRGQEATGRSAVTGGEGKGVIIIPVIIAKAVVRRRPTGVQ